MSTFCLSLSTSHLSVTTFIFSWILCVTVKVLYSSLSKKVLSFFYQYHKIEVSSCTYIGQNLHTHALGYKDI